MSKCAMILAYSPIDVRITAVHFSAPALSKHCPGALGHSAAPQTQPSNVPCQSNSLVRIARNSSTSAWLAHRTHGYRAVVRWSGDFSTAFPCIKSHRHSPARQTSRPLSLPAHAQRYGRCTHFACGPHGACLTGLRGREKLKGRLEGKMGRGKTQGEMCFEVLDFSARSQPAVARAARANPTELLRATSWRVAFLQLSRRVTSVCCEGFCAYVARTRSLLTGSAVCRRLVNFEDILSRMSKCARLEELYPLIRSARRS